jgi:hypothetical protein
MKSYVFSVLLLFLDSSSTTNGFAPSAMIAKRRLGALHARALEQSHDSTHYRYFLAKARECAYSDTGTSAEARSYMTKILEFESDCVSGALMGGICENIDEVADTVAHLREKIEKNEKNVVAVKCVQ